MDNILTEVRPDIVLVYGDTTLAATLASFQVIGVGHVEVVCEQVTYQNHGLRKQIGD